MVATSADMSPDLRALEGATGYTALARVLAGAEGAAIASDPAFVDARAQGFEGADPYVFYGSWAAVYVDSTAAHNALQAFDRMFRSSDFFNGRAPRDAGLGDESVLFEGLNGQQPAIVYMWREDNVLLRAWTMGALDAAVVRRIANAMQARVR